MASITLQQTNVARLWAEWTTTTDPANNQSTTRAVLKLTTLNNYNIGSWGDFNGSYFGSTSDTFDGSIPNFSGTRDLAVCTKTVSHNNEGKGSLTIYWKWGVNSPWGGFVNPSGSFNVDLPEIPRVTQPTLSDSDVNIGDSVTITLNRALSKHKHNIALYFGNNSLMLAENVDTSFKWTVPEVIAKWIPNAEYMDAKITAFTYENGNLNGSKSTNIKIRIPSSAKPTISSVTIEEAAQTIESIGLFVQGFSKLKVDTKASGAMYSTISTIQSVIENVTYTGNSFTTGVLAKSGDLKVTVDVTDSRGRKATTSKTIKVYEYKPPQIYSFDARRADSGGNIKENGTHARISYSYEITPLENKNGKTVTLKYKKTQEQSYTTLKAFNDYKLDSFYLSASLFELSDSYDVMLEIKDSFASVTTQVKIETERVPLELMHTGLGVSVGKAAELDETFDIDLSTLFRKDVQFEQILNVANGLTTKPIQIVAGDDLNNYINTSGLYYVAGAVSNRPVEASGFLIVYANGANSIYQKYISLSGLTYERIKDGSGWTPWCGWYKYTGMLTDVYVGLDGRYEAYGLQERSYPFATALNGVYTQSFKYGIPLPLPNGIKLKSEPAVLFQAYADNDWILSTTEYAATDVNTYVYYRMAKHTAASGNIAVKHHVHVMGRWK